ncbi:MAG: hypothetical protein DCC73_00870 [Proteobacteria bacterium]|nr:MAG: hypothetical protein DCC73_00870 [Pseudomonadota bacterium]
MGGHGSGRQYGVSTGTKPVAGVDLLRLDVRYLHKNGFLKPQHWSTLHWSRNGHPSGNIRVEMGTGQPPLHLKLIYTHTSRYDGTKTDINEYITLDWQTCRFGGRRPWFLCPHCGRRVGVLWGSKRFLCRHCHRVAYPCQNETRADRAMRQSRKVRQRLGLRDDITIPAAYASKPKGMRWATYHRLVRQAQEADMIWCLDAMRRFGIGIRDSFDMPWPE